LLVAIGLAVLVLVGGGVTIIALASQPSPQDIALQKSETEARGVVEKFAVLFAQARNDGAFSLSKSDVKACCAAVSRTRWTRNGRTGRPRRSTGPRRRRRPPGWR